MPKGRAPAKYNRATLCDATFFPLRDRKNPPNATFNVYRASDDNWFLIVLTPDMWPALAMGIGHPNLLSDVRFSDAAKQAANSAQLTAILDEVFSSQPMAHWRQVFDHAHVPFGVVQKPSEVINDPQLRENNIIVPLEGAGGNLKSTIRSPIQVHGVTEVPAKRAPEIGEHNEEVLKELGFDAKAIDSLRASGAIPGTTERGTVT
jgi:crotonobetainyl-CoA:carnitine CoA-transferase CaiB-like acyl-CoA transferase